MEITIQFEEEIAQIIADNNDETTREVITNLVYNMSLATIKEYFEQLKTETDKGEDPPLGMAVTLSISEMMKNLNTTTLH